MADWLCLDWFEVDGRGEMSALSFDTVGLDTPFGYKPVLFMYSIALRSSVQTIRQPNTPISTRTSVNRRWLYRLFEVIANQEVRQEHDVTDRCSAVNVAVELAAGGPDCQ